MKRFIPMRVLLSWCALLAATSTLSALETISKNSSSEVFTNPVAAKALDQCNGTFYVSVAGNEGTSSLASAAFDATVFTPLATDADVNGATFKANGLALIQSYTKKDCDSETEKSVASHLATLRSGAGYTDRVTLVNIKTSNALTTASALNTSNNVAANNVSFVETSTVCVFARALAGAAENTNYDSIATLRVDPAHDGLTAVQGSASIRSVVLAPNLPQTAALRTKTGAINVATLNTLEMKDMHWDNDLERLYVAVRIVKTTPVVDTTYFGILVGRLDNNCTLTFDRAITGLSPQHKVGTPATALANNNIFVVTAANQLGPIEIHINKIRTMKTSTGLYYLIFNGDIKQAGDGVAAIDVGNFIYGFPLGSPGSGSQGLIVKKTVSECITGQSCKFLDTLYSFSEITNLDGGCPLKIGNDEAPWDEAGFADDMVVVGDTVYASRAANRASGSTATDPGIWASQAMFDCKGAVANWTRWERVLTSTSGGSGANSIGDHVPLFEVDARTGKIWRLDSIKKRVQRTAWNTSESNATADSLVSTVSKLMPDGVYTMLDIVGNNAGNTEGELGFSGSNSYILFGGCSKVLFIRSRGDNFTVTLPTAFSSTANPENVRLTTAGLESAGVVTALGYTRVSDSATNSYFFAGTPTGLYAFADANGNGFNVSTNPYAALNAAPMNTTGAKWHKVPGISGQVSINHIEANCSAGDNDVFVLAQDATSQYKNSDKLYHIRVQTSVSNFAPRLIAESGVSGLPTNALFTGFALLGDDDSGTGCIDDQNFGMISTNDGIYTSTARLRHLVKPTSGTEWIKIDRTDGQGFNFLRRVSKRCQQPNKSIGVFHSQDKNSCYGTFDKSRFIQIGVCGAAGQGTGARNAAPDSCAECVLDRTFWTAGCPGISNIDSTTHIWTDGARRFFTRFNPDETVFNALHSLPYDCSAWCMSAPYADPALASIKRINWIESVGTGQLLAATDTGVLALM